MPALPKSRMLSTLARTQFRRQTPHIQNFGRRAYSMSEFQTIPSKIIEGAKGDWGLQVKKIGNGLALYVPIVACVMFWPYAAAPIMQTVQTNW